MPEAPQPGWGRTIATVLARVLVCVSVSLLAWSLVPVALGWNSSVVLSGSMQPGIDPGDVVLSAPADQATLVPGRVIMFRDPAEPGRTVVHRIVEVQDDGSIRTKGDNNRDRDVAAVAPSDVIGLARLRVPVIGLPVIWTIAHQWLLLGTAAAVFAVAAAILISDRERERRRRLDEDEEDTPGAPVPPRARAVPELFDQELPWVPKPLAAEQVPQHPQGELRRWRRIALLTGAGAAFLAGSFVGQLAGPGVAAFEGSTLASAGWHTPGVEEPEGRYVATVLADKPALFYRLDESNGWRAEDLAPTDSTGIYQGAWARATLPEPLPNNPGRAAWSTGRNSCIFTPNNSKRQAPTSGSMELWIRTSSKAGGKLVGFESSRTGLGSSYDRMLYLQTNGTVRMGLRVGGRMTTLTTKQSVNDHSWHHIVGTFGAKGLRLYVDGTLSSSAPMNGKTESYSGWWRWACGNLSDWPGAPSSAASTSRYLGQIANVSVAEHQWSDKEIEAHHDAA